MKTAPVLVVRKTVAQATVTAANAIASNIRIPLGGGSRRVLGFDLKFSEPSKLGARTLIGVGSFHLDNKAKHPMHFAFEDKPIASFTRKQGYQLLLDEPVSDGCIVDGYFQDSGLLPGGSYPYNVTITITSLHEVE